MERVLTGGRFESLGVHGEFSRGMAHGVPWIIKDHGTTNTTAAAAVLSVTVEDLSRVVEG
jgi:hypothetical protein